MEDHVSMPEGAKSSQDPISTNGLVQKCMAAIPAMWGSTNRKITVQVSLGIKQDTISK
jgi:hypothetical protein